MFESVSVAAREDEERAVLGLKVTGELQRPATVEIYTRSDGTATGGH